MARTGWGWPVGITLLLTAFVGGNLYMMRVASDDPAFAIEPDYYRKAVDFDSTMALEQRSALLHWTATAAIERGAGRPMVVVALADSLKQPVSSAHVTVRARFNARANDVLSDTLAESAPGRYASQLDVRHAGEWELQIDARRGVEHFLTSVRAEAPSVLASAVRGAVGSP